MRELIVESVWTADPTYPGDWGRVRAYVLILGIPLLVEHRVELDDVKVFDRAGNCQLVHLESEEADRLWSMIEERANE